MGRVFHFIKYDQAGCSAAIVFPLWDTQPWFLTLIHMCNAVYKLPLRGNKLFNKISNFPCAPYIKNQHWEYAVGFVNMPIINKPQWQSLHFHHNQVVDKPCNAN